MLHHPNDLGILPAGTVCTAATWQPVSWLKPCLMPSRTGMTLLSPDLYGDFNGDYRRGPTTFSEATTGVANHGYPVFFYLSQ